MAERKILASNTNPFLVSLKFSFQTSDKIYFVLDYISGGELFVHLQVSAVICTICTASRGLRSGRAASARSGHGCTRQC